MTIQLSAAMDNGALDSYETTMGAAPILELRSGAKPANNAAADSGTLLATAALPSDFMAAASGRSKAKNGTWTVTGGAGASTGTTIGHFRIKDSSGTTCHIQGSYSITGGGGDMTGDSSTIAQNQVVTVNTFTLTQNNG